MAAALAVVAPMRTGCGLLGRGTGFVGTVTFALLVVLAAGTQPSDAASDAGQVVVVSATDLRNPIESGEHTTTFTIRVPDGAECPGDSMNDDWRLQTFFVPSSDDPAELTYYVTGPAGPEDDRRVSLYTADGRPYVDELLPANDRPGLPAEIPTFPPMSFKRLPVDYLPTGSYLLGVACTDRAGRTQRYWDTSVDVLSGPGIMQWRVTAAQPNSPGSSTRLWSVPVLVVAGVLLLLVAIVLWRRAGRDAATDHSTGAV